MASTPYDHIADRFHAIRTQLHPNESKYLSLLLDPLAEGSTVLDLGCGTGTPIAEAIAARGHRIVGVDGSASMLAMAKRRLPEHRWIHSRMESVELNETFDAVVCWDSMFHLPRQQHADMIRKMHRWLNPGGRLMVSSGGVVENENGFTDTMFGHEFFYDSLPPQQMVAMIRDAGFKILLAEMCSAPDGDRDKGKWATIAEKGGGSYTAALQ